MKGYRLQVVGYSFLLFVLLSTVHCTLYPVFAADDIGQSKIYPTHPLYFLKSFREILELKFAPTSEIKAVRYLEFSQRRIREVKALVEARRADLIAPTLEHYLFNLQKVLGLMDLKNEAKAKQVADTVYMHLQYLEDIYAKIDHEAARRAIRTTLFKLSEWNRQFQERLDPKFQEMFFGSLRQSQSKICNFLQKEASSSALNEVEKAVLSERVQKCYQGLQTPL